MKLLPCLQDIVDIKIKFDSGKIAENYFWRKYKKLRLEFYLSEEWKSVRKEARNRDVVCQKCGKDHGKLEVHHIIFLYVRPDLALDITNLILLCVKCHKNIHKKDARLSKTSKTRRNSGAKTNRISGQRVRVAPWRASKLR